MGTSSPTPYLCIGVVLLGLLVNIFAGNFLENNRIEIPEEYHDQDLHLKGEQFKGYVFGAEGLVADWYWVRALQYIGGKILKSNGNGNGRLDLEDLTPLNPRLAYPYLDSATSLDPHFIEVYLYGSIVLPSIDKEQAIKIAKKGIENNPEQWRLYQHLGYIYWKIKDYENAADTYEKGSMIEGSPTFMKIMAANMRTRGSSRDTARAIYQQMLDAASDTKSVEHAKLRLLVLDSLDERESIQKVLNEFKIANGSCPRSLRDVTKLLSNIVLPNGKSLRVDSNGNVVDPGNVPYLIEAEKCKVVLDKEKTKLPRE